VAVGRQDTPADHVATIADVGVNSFGGFNGATTNTSTMIKLGWLILDIYDTKQKKDIWEAQVSKTLGNGKDPKKMSKNAEKVMAKVFKGYPPSGK